MKGVAQRRSDRLLGAAVDHPFNSASTPVRTAYRQKPPTTPPTSVDIPRCLLAGEATRTRFMKISASATTLAPITSPMNEKAKMFMTR
jgi:hypothetical protein